MPIPGTTPQREVRAKVRVGEKVMRGGRELPSSIDHFVCDDADFNARFQGAKEIPVYLPDEESSFTSGLEWWQGKLLVCYSKGEKRENDYEAYRLPTLLKDGRQIDLLANARVLTEEKKGRDRSVIACPVRDCPYLKAKTCRPKGRLQFYIDGIDRAGGVYQLDTQSWNSIEKIEGTLKDYPDPRGVPFVLGVTMLSNAKSRYPVVSLKPRAALPEATSVGGKRERQKDWAALLVQAGYLLNGDGSDLAEGKTELEAKMMLTLLLDFRYPGWRQDILRKERLVRRIEAVGVVPALAKMVEEGLA